MRAKRHCPNQIEIDFSVPPPLPFEQAVERARCLLAEQSALGERWWRWVEASLDGDPDRVTILCALSFSRR